MDIENLKDEPTQATHDAARRILKRADDLYPVLMSQYGMTPPAIMREYSLACAMLEELQQQATAACAVSTAPPHEGQPTSTPPSPPKRPFIRDDEPKKACCYCHTIQPEMYHVSPRATECADRKACLLRRAKSQPERCPASCFAIQGSAGSADIGYGLRCDKRNGHEGGHVHFCMFTTRVNNGFDTVQPGEKIEWGELTALETAPERCRARWRAGVAPPIDSPPDGARCALLKGHDFAHVYQLPEKGHP